MRSGRARAPVVVLLAALLAAACGDGPTPRPPARWSDGSLPRYRDAGLAAPMTAPVRVALLAPLSGPAAAYGESLVNAAALAVFESRAVRPIEILPRDTAGAEGAAAAAAADVAAQGAAAVISASPDRAARVAADIGAPLLLLSGDRGSVGAGVFAAGHAPEAAATRIVDYAYRQGVRRIAAMAPETAAGVAALRGMEAAAAARGMQVARSAVAPQGVDPAVFADAYRAVSADVGADGAVFLPFEGPALRAVADAVALSEGVSPLILGAAGWLAAPAETLMRLEGAVFPGPDPAALQAFEARYIATFGAAPAADAALVYDLTAMAGAASSTVSGARLTIFDIAAPAGFRGLEGPFRFRSDGAVERRYAVLGVEGGAVRTVEPAPARFEGG